MQVFVYRSRRQADTYVYLRERDAFACLPDELAARLAPFDFSLDFELTPERRLAREDPAVVRHNLLARGFHLQLPPGEHDRAPR
jgi:hypothetical protein